jgi:branched-chain amino acid transport system permease protein
LPLALAAATAGAGAVGVLFERLAIRPAQRASPSILLLLTVGAAATIRGAGVLLWGKDPHSIPVFFPGPPLFVGRVAITTQALVVMATLLASAVGLWVFFERTLYGKAMRACADNPTAARLVGLNVAAIRQASFALSAALGGLAGAAILPLGFADYQAGVGVTLKGFVAAALGGMGSPAGAVAGGLVLGLVEGYAAGLISSQFKDTLAMLALLVVLALRPSGLFGRTQ